MKIVTFPNPLLKKVLQPFDFSNPTTDPVELEKNMIDCMLKNKAIGLAANQIGLDMRVFVMGHPTMPDNAQAFFNPEILAVTEDKIDYEEGCLSFPNIYATITRPKAIKVKYQNSKGEDQFAELRDYECRCFLHEFDHLEGITFNDRLSPLKWALSVKKSTKRKYK